MVQLERGLENGRLAPTLLFVGPSGVGKKMFALGLVQALVCERHKMACGECPSCLRVEKKQSESLLLIEPDSTQIKVDQAKEVVNFVSLQKVGKARAVIIDAAERLNPAAANSLLKTLEEPPEGSYFILLATSLSAILPTIRSRAQSLRFAPLSRKELRKIAAFEEWVLNACAGSVERAQWLSTSGELQDVRAKAFSLVSAVARGESGVLGELKDLVKDKSAALFLAQTLQRWVRDLQRIKMGDTRELSNPDQLEWSQQVAEVAESRWVEGLWQKSRGLERDILGNVDRQLSFENFFLQIARLKAPSP